VLAVVLFVAADLPVFEKLRRLADETLFRSITSQA